MPRCERNHQNDDEFSSDKGDRTRIDEGGKGGGRYSWLQYTLENLRYSISAI